MLLCSLFGVTLDAKESLDSLLKEYRKNADLSKKTKKESAGFLQVYTRDDLERMQVYRLSDILKSARFLQYDLNSFGMTDPLQMNPVLYSSDLIKIFVNDYEITTGFVGSGYAFYGNIDMDMIDHVEIYTGTPVLNVSTEPAAIVIKLYTKVSERENGASLQLRGAERGTKEGSLSLADELDGWSYYAYVHGVSEKYRHIKNGAYDISKDYRQSHAFLNLHNLKHNVELELLKQRHDPFTGFSTTVEPVSGYWKSPMLRASYSSKWFDDSLSADISYINSSFNINSVTASPSWFQLKFPDTIRAGENSLDYKVKGDVLTMKLAHNRKIGNNQINIGAEYRYKNADFEYFRINDTPIDMGRAKFNIAGLFLEDHYMLTDNSMATFSLKYNFYDLLQNQGGNEFKKHLNTWQGRVGYSLIEDMWSFKGFLTHTEVPQQLYMVLIENMPLDRYSFDTLSSELKLRGFKGEWKYLLMLSRADSADADSSSTLVKSNVYIVNTSLDFRFDFDRFNYLSANIFLSHANKRYFNFRKNYVGGYLRLLNTFGKTDLFNELVFREGSGEIKNGYDYSVGVEYHVTKDFSISVKGVNVFDSARKSRYRTLDMSTNPPLEGGMNLPVIDRRVYFSMEWMF